MPGFTEYKRLPAIPHVSLHAAAIVCSDCISPLVLPVGLCWAVEEGNFFHTKVDAVAGAVILLLLLLADVLHCDLVCCA